MRCAVVVAAGAKEHSGVRAVEEAVKSVIGPIYDKFHLVPDVLLRIADRSADTAAHQPHAPPRNTASGIAGAVYAKCEPSVKVLYERYEAKAEQCAAAAWRRHWTEKYSEKVAAEAEKGCRVSALVHTEKVAPSHLSSYIYNYNPFL